MRYLLLCAAVACERAPIGEVVFVPPVVVETAEPRITVTMRQEPAPAIELPAPPRPGVAYKAWLASLTPAEERGTYVFCTRHALDVQARCGGIGPLHIPPRPHRFPGRFADKRSTIETDYRTWSASLTVAQHAYISDHCGEDTDAPDLCGERTPLVVAFDDRPIAFHPGATFAFVAGYPVATDWPDAPWIALDRDGDGAITSGAELFGNHTARGVQNGFAALAALDANHDGQIDRDDPAFARLLLWTDRDGDGASSPDELAPLADSIAQISLANHVEPRCDARGNCEGERAAIRTTSGQVGAVVDVYLR